MPLQHAVLYQAFCEITNFIRNNGDDWDEFCTKTAHTTRKAKKALSLSKQPNKGLLASKPLLQENPHHFVLLPIHHADIWWMCKKAEASFWTAKEINLSVDLTDRVRLSDTKCLAFVAASDGILNKNLSSNFATKVTAPEAQSSSMASRLQSKTSTARRTPSSLTRTPRIQKRNCTYLTPSK